MQDIAWQKTTPTFDLYCTLSVMVAYLILLPYEKLIFTFNLWEFIVFSTVIKTYHCLLNRLFRATNMKPDATLHDAIAWCNRMTPTVISSSDVRNMCANRRLKNTNHTHVSGWISLLWANTWVIKHSVLCTAQGIISNQIRDTQCRLWGQNTKSKTTYE